MRSLPLTLGARLLPVAVLAAAGVAMTTTPDSEARPKPSAHSPRPSTSAPSAPSSGAPVDGSSGAPVDGQGDDTAAARYPKPPAKPCATLPAGTVKDLVPGAPAAGTVLTTSDATRRSGCSWHALSGFDYRWLDITYDVSAAAATRARSEQGDGPSTSVPGLGDQGSVSLNVTTDDKQRIREAVVVARRANAVVTVTYNGGDFETQEAAGTDEIRQGALTAAKKALSALDG
ncbi:hypothetical protein [Streptomyces lonegramiae]|uniref:DUF3558 domain-containing protein n=1 Tax=Streptomyces lonegramiae TaxID=3075524 RepID=A0ABU2X9J5_9ACTN|nr:hypothetical protein [Streptomyces sp. DSM 41529]MDT0542581.1 hypothetical protein [Streptomyces sp. DSM 41529]